MSKRDGNINISRCGKDIVHSDNSFIAGLKRLAEERRVANDKANNRERVIAADQLDDNNRNDTGKVGRSNNPAKDENGTVPPLANEAKRDDNIPDMTGKVISLSTENQPLPSSKQQQQHHRRRRDDSNKQRQKKKSGTNASHPKNKPTPISQLEDGLLPDMTGKEILVDHLELPSIEPVKEEVDLDDL